MPRGARKMRKLPEHPCRHLRHAQECKSRREMINWRVRRALVGAQPIDLRSCNVFADVDRGGRWDAVALALPSHALAPVAARNSRRPRTCINLQSSSRASVHATARLGFMHGTVSTTNKLLADVFSYLEGFKSSQVFRRRCHPPASTITLDHSTNSRRQNLSLYEPDTYIGEEMGIACSVDR